MSYDLSKASETMATHEIPGVVQVRLGYIGEGMSGDYNPSDPADVPFLRVDALDLTVEGKRSDQDTSFCTLLPITVPLEVLQSVCRHIATTLFELPTWSRKMEEFSWLDEKEAHAIHARFTS